MRRQIPKQGITPFAVRGTLNNDDSPSSAVSDFGDDAFDVEVDRCT